MKRILIIGCGGSGKSTLAVKLSGILSLPVVHLDKLFWIGDWENVEKEKFDKALAEELKKDTWIIDGNYDRTLKGRMKRCDTLIYLDYPTAVCLWGAVKRVIKYYGKIRPDMGGKCRERFDAEFFGWIISFRRRYREKYLSMLNEARDEGKNVFIFKNRRMCASFVRDLDK